MKRDAQSRRFVGYLAQVAGGLVPFAALAIALNAYVAAEAIVAALIVAATATGNLLLRDEL